MSKSDLFKQAIAEAKELKDISMAQAKQQIAEAFAPRIQEMFAAKVDAMDEADEMEEGMDKMEEMSSKEKMAKGLYNEEDEMNETSLDEILAELDAESKMEEGDDLEMEGLDLEESKDLEEAKKDDDKEDEKEEESEEAEEAEGDDLAAAAGADLDGMGSDLGGDQEVVDLSVEEFKNLVRDVVADVLAGGAGDGMGDDMGDLDDAAAGLDLGADGDMGAGMGSDLEVQDEAFSLDEILEQLEKEGLEEDDDKAKAAAMHDMEADGVDTSVLKEKEEELEEAIKTIEELKSTINEMNLFNAKLLYTNKVFESKSLNNTQKAKVLNAFDKAHNLNEVKAVYKTLNTTLDSGQRTQLKESLGFASKAMGGAPAKPILEENAYVNRFQQLAGIKKLY